MGELFFFRHGQASFGSDNYDRLSEKGLRQAEILGRHLAGLDMKFDAVFTGGMDRQRQTAMQVKKAYDEKGLFFPEPVVDAAWNEMNSTRVWDAQVSRMLADEPALLDDLKKDVTNRKAFQSVFSKVMDRWVSGGFDAPEDITWQEFKQQVTQGLPRLCTPSAASGKIAVFSSGGPISVVIQASLNLSGTKTLDLLWQILNASVTRLKYNGQKISLAGFNDITHLELTYDRTLITYR